MYMDVFTVMTPNSVFLSVRNALSRNKQLANAQGLYVLVDEYDAFSNGFLEPYKTT